MCIEIVNNNENSTTGFKNSTNVSYKIKRLVKQFFNSKKESSGSQFIISREFENSQMDECLTSLENLRNSDIESECTSIESEDNLANERLSCEMENFEFADITSIPVNFTRTEQGTFFWMTSSYVPADNDLIEPICCHTYNQIAVSQSQDRWAQA